LVAAGSRLPQSRLSGADDPMLGCLLLLNRALQRTGAFGNPAGGAAGARAEHDAVVALRHGGERRIANAI